MGFRDLMTVRIKVALFCDVTFCSSEITNISNQHSASILTLKKTAESEHLLTFHYTTRRNIPKSQQYSHKFLINRSLFSYNNWTIHFQPVLNPLTVIFSSSGYIEKGYGLDYRRIRVRFLADASDLTFRPALRPTPPPIQWVAGALSPRVKRPGREADHSLPPSVGIKNDGAIPPFLLISSWHNA
jgi:hypothetical protein